MGWPWKTAYYQLAEAALATQAYDVAVDKFHSLAQRFPSSPEARQAHADLAKSLLGRIRHRIGGRRADVARRE